MLARQGGFFLLDGRKHTNNTDNPELLEVMIFNGNGEYTLHEDKDLAQMHTHFVSHEFQNKQVLDITVDGDTQIMSQRTYKLCFKNIRKGEVRAYKNGSPISVDIDDAGDYIEILLKDANTSSKYTVEVSYKDDRTEYRNARLLYSILRLEGNNHYKSVWLRELIKHNDNECIQLIDQKQGFTKRQKNRVKEAW